MHFNNKEFGDGKDALTKSIFTETTEFEAPKPPPPDAFYLITNSGDNLVTNTEDYFVTNGDT
jgi:hypothetical protein